MSDSAAAQDLKGGHAPAQKVGGMRVVTKPREEKAPPPKPTEEEIEEFGEDKAEKKGDMVVSGAKTVETDAFPTEAVKAFHEKPVPTHQKNMANTKPNIIQQPRK